MQYDIDHIKKKFNSAVAKRDILTKNLKEYEVSIEKTIETRNCVEEAQVFLQKKAQETQNQLKFHIEDIVQLCLDTCFPDRYEFKLEFEIKRGKTEAALICYDNGEEFDIMDAADGGPADIFAFGLRIAAWALGRTRNTMILDEPVKFLSDDLQPRFGEIIRELSRTLKLQMIIVTHRMETTNIADRVFNIALEKNGKWYQSKVDVIDNSEGSKYESSMG